MSMIIVGLKKLNMFLQQVAEDLESGGMYGE